MRHVASIVLAAACAAACTTGPTFQDTVSTRPRQDRVLIDHRIADEQTVRTTCYWRARDAGAKLHEGPLGCTWEEDGRAVVLCPDAGSFNNHLALEACGHEAYHAHAVIDHR